jgi:hypothetical protein
MGPLRPNATCPNFLYDLLVAELAQLPPNMHKEVLGISGPAFVCLFVCIFSVQRQLAAQVPCRGTGRAELPFLATTLQVSRGSSSTEW